MPEPFLEKLNEALDVLEEQGVQPFVDFSDWRVIALIALFLLIFLIYVRRILAQNWPVTRGPVLGTRALVSRVARPCSVGERIGQACFPKDAEVS